MTFVVTESCIKCKLTDCVEVCPVDCFHEGPNFLVIDPEECIDCTLCEPECPVEAIYSEDELPEGQEKFIEINAELVLKATKVDGVYTDDPMRNPDAVKYDRLTFDEALERKLGVMDLTAICLCRDHQLPVRVFQMEKVGALLNIVRGGDEGTLIE